MGSWWEENIVRIIVCIVVGVAVFGLPRLLHKLPITPTIVIGWAAISMYVIALLVITVGVRTYSPNSKINLNLFQCIRGLANQISYWFRTYGFRFNAEQYRIIANGILTIVLNIFLFVPLGYLMPLCFKGISNLYRIAIVGFGVSLLIEAVQLIMHRGFFDVDDLFLNTIGTMIGWRIYAKILRKKASTE